MTSNDLPCHSGAPAIIEVIELFCTRCGAHLTGDAKFCAGCGTEVVKGSSQRASSRPSIAQAAPTGSGMLFSRTFKVILICIPCGLTMLIGGVGLASGNTVGITRGAWTFLIGTIAMALAIWWGRQNRTGAAAMEVSSMPIAQGTLVGAFANHRQSLTGRQIASALFFSIIGLGTLGAVVHGQKESNFRLVSSTLPSIYNCGEPLIIEECSADTLGLPVCRVRNVSTVPLGQIGGWAYDNQGTRVGSPSVQSLLL